MDSPACNARPRRVPRLVTTATQRGFRHINSSPTSRQQVISTMVKYPATMHGDPSHVHLQKTVISVAAVRRTSGFAAKARDAREMYSVSKVSYGAELESSADVFWCSRDCTTSSCASQTSVSLSSQRSAPYRGSSRSGARCCSLSAATRSTLFSRVSWCRSHCGEPALALLQRPPRFARDLCVPTLVSCWSVPRPRSHSVPRCGVLIRHCSVSTTTSPTCVAQCASCLQMLTVVFRSIQRRLPQRVHESSRRSPRLDLGTTTRHMPCGASVVRHVSSV